MTTTQILALAVITGLVCVVAVVVLTDPPRNPHLAILELMLWFDIPAAMMAIALREKFPR